MGSNVHQVKTGDVVFVPSDEEHGIWNGDGNGADAVEQQSSENEDEREGGELKWLYIFAADGFGEIKYRFS